ncbi:zinc ribbon domain-containing protein [Streptomyces chartreusis]|uniref:zinc ribbon domain-containing protein n=1 Tax=Streptomyces chartreusis TaxID=1969 RepID=UPI00381132F0
MAAVRWFPSSKTCSGCDAVKAKLALYVRTYECDTCGVVIDRDANAALNRAALAAAAGTGVAGDQDIAPAVSKPRGADQKDPHHPARPQGQAGAGRWRNPAAAEGSQRPSSNRSAHAVVM